MLAFALSNNTYMLCIEKQDLPQYAFKEIIDQAKQPSLLNYGFLDGGFYTVCDIVPDCKYFCKLNIQLEEMNKIQECYIENGLSDFVVTCDNEINNELYEPVAEIEYEFENKPRKYALYALKELSLQ